MKVTTEKTENRQAYLKIEVEPAEIEAGTAKAYKRLVNRVNVPGFRRGKAPRIIFENHFGHHELFHEALDDIIPDAYNKAVDNLKLDPVAQPHLEMVQEEPVIFTAVVPLKPVVTLGDYKTVDMKPEPIEITEETIEKVIDRLRHQYATWEPVEREVVLSDLVTLDIESTLQAEPFINQKGVQYQINKDSVNPAPGFGNQLVGVKKGEEKEFNIKFPDDFTRNEVAGKEARFKVKIIEIKQEKLPEVTDDFALQVDPEYKTVAILRAKVKENLQSHADNEAKQTFEDKVIAAATAISQVEYPPIMVEVEIDHLIDRQFRFLQNSGQDMQQYLRTINKTPEAMRGELKPAAEKTVTESLVLGKIAEAEKVTVTPEEIEAEIDRLCEISKGDKDAVRRAMQEEKNRRSVENQLITRKTINLMVELAQKTKTGVDTH